MSKTKKAAQPKAKGEAQKGKGPAKDAPKRMFDNAIEIVNPTLLSAECRAELRKQYEESEPYLHCVMKDIFNPEALTRVRDEIVENIQATYKETDLFKVFQTGDLGNLDKLDAEAAAKLPTLGLLKEALYSTEFRAFIREVTGCGELADKTDCSCNVYAHGGHLLCHDDVIGTRRVSWIIYLTDPSEQWTEADGGALELYPLKEGALHTPSVHPTLNHLPIFNTMAMFTVMPGKSFHAVQEVFAQDKPRMSISGWYHAPHEPEDADKASLKQLQAPAGDSALVAGGDNAGISSYKLFDGCTLEMALPKPKAEQPKDVVKQEAAANGNGQEASGEDAPMADVEALATDDAKPADHSAEPAAATTAAATAAEPSTTAAERAVPPTGHDLSEADLALLGKFVNPAYLSPKAWESIQRKFAQDGSVQLKDFLRNALAQRILAATAEADETDKLGGGKAPAYTAGVGNGWEPTGPPHKQRYLSYTGVDAAATSALDGPSAGQLLAQVRDELFKSAAFARLLRALTSLTMVGVRGEARRFRPGLDYTVAHYGILTKDPRLDAVLTFVDDRSGGGAARAAWDDGEVGGFEAYLLADEGEETAGAAEVYRTKSVDDESGVLNVSAAANCLNLVLRDEGLMKFVKYVSYAAPSSRWDIAMEYLPEDDGQDSEEEDEKEQEPEEAPAPAKTAARKAKAAPKAEARAKRAAAPARAGRKVAKKEDREESEEEEEEEEEEGSEGEEIEEEESEEEAKPKKGSRSGKREAPAKKAAAKPKAAPAKGKSKGSPAAKRARR